MQNISDSGFFEIQEQYEDQVEGNIVVTSGNQQPESDQSIINLQQANDFNTTNHLNTLLNQQEEYANIQPVQENSATMEQKQNQPEDPFQIYRNLELLENEESSIIVPTTTRTTSNSTDMDLESDFDQK